MSHKHGYLNMTRTRMTPIDMLMWKGNAQESSTLKKNYRELKNAEKGRKIVIPREEHSNWLSNINQSELCTHSYK